MDNSGERVPPHHRTVDRVAALLETAARHPDGVTLSGLAREVGAPVSSVQKLVDGLTAVGFLDGHGRRYRFGTAPYVLALRAGLPPVSVPHARLAQAAGLLGVPVLLAVRLGEDAVHVDWAGADESLDAAIGARLRRPLPDTAAGRVLFAYLPERQRREIAVAAHGADAASLMDALDRAAAVRERGYEYGPSGPLLPGDAVAVPVLRDGRVVAAVSAADRHGALAGRTDEAVRALAEAARPDTDTGPAPDAAP